MENITSKNPLVKIPLTSKYQCAICGGKLKLSYSDWEWRKKYRGTVNFFCSQKCKGECLSKLYKGHNFGNQGRKKNPAFWRLCTFCGKSVYATDKEMLNHNGIKKDKLFCNQICLRGWWQIHKKVNIPHPRILPPLFEFDCVACGKHIIKSRKQSIPYRTLVKKGRTTFYCSYQCNPATNGTRNKGKHRSLDTREKIRLGNLHGRKPPVLSKRNLSKRLRGCYYNKRWKKEVVIDANGVCQKCQKITGNLHAHHLKSLEKLIAESGLTDYWKLVNYAPLWDKKNGVAWCEECHAKFHHFTPKD